jgi:hypothetical protein
VTLGSVTGILAFRAALHVQGASLLAVWLHLSGRMGDSIGFKTGVVCCRVLHTLFAAKARQLLDDCEPPPTERVPPPGKQDALHEATVALPPPLLQREGAGAALEATSCDTAVGVPAFV